MRQPLFIAFPYASACGMIYYHIPKQALAERTLQTQQCISPTFHTQYSGGLLMTTYDEYLSMRDILTF